MKKYLFLILTLSILLSLGALAVPVVVGGVGDLTNGLTVTPEEYATADDVVVVAARLHSIYNGGSVSEASSVGECYKYAEENGIIFEDIF